MNIFSATSLFVFITCFPIGVLIFLRGGLKNVSRLLGLACIASSLWGLGAFKFSSTSDYEQALFWIKFAHLGIILTPAFFYHFITLWTKDYHKYLILLLYICTSLFISCTYFYDKFFQVTFMFNQFYFFLIGKENVLYFLFYVLFYWFYVMHALYLLVKYFIHSKGRQRNQLKYFLIGMIMAWAGPEGMFLLVHGIRTYPFTNILIGFYPFIFAYAILKYQLLDIRVAISRLTIFAIVYALVLGIPFYIYFALNRPFMALVIMGILATVGPFIYLFFQKKAEKRILQEDHRTQDLILQASYGMNMIHHLDRLTDLIVEVVMKILRVEKASIYLLNQDGDEYHLVSPKKGEKKSITITADHPLIEMLKTKRFPVVYEEMKGLVQSYSRDSDSMITDLMNDIKASVTTPILINGTLLGFLALGERRTKEVYSKDLLNVLTVLGNQAALAIENCHYLEAEAKRMEEDAARDRMASLDHMASSMAHEIDNPMHALRQSLGFIDEFLLQDPRISMPDEIKKDFKDSIARSQDCAKRVSSMIKAILDYSKMGTGELTLVRINDAFEDFLELISPQLKGEKAALIIDVEDNLPLIFGDKIQLEEIFMNFVQNSLHAVKRNEGDQEIMLKIFKMNSKFIRIECKDNGYGITKNMLSSIFLSSTTTKGSSEGTGLGLYRVRKIVDLFKGKVWAESDGKGKGATLIVELPICEEHAQATLKNDMMDDSGTKKE